MLAQLGNRVQHALRAHTPDDDKALTATVRTFPKTEFYDLEQTLTSLGIGEAVVTALDPRGVPTPVVATRLIPPTSRMAPLTPDEFQADIRSSDLLAEYGHIGGPGERQGDAGQANREDGGDGGACRAGQGRRARRKTGKMLGGALLGSLAATVGRTVGRELVRGMFGLMGAKPPRTTRRRTTRW